MNQVLFYFTLAIANTSRLKTTSHGRKAVLHEIMPVKNMYLF